MSRRRTGLRNRDRTGIGPYSRQNKTKKAERYDRPMLDHPNHPGGPYNSCCNTQQEVRNG